MTSQSKKQKPHGLRKRYLTRAGELALDPAYWQAVDNAIADWNERFPSQMIPAPRHIPPHVDQLWVPWHPEWLELFESDDIHDPYSGDVITRWGSCSWIAERFYLLRQRLMEKWWIERGYTAWGSGTYIHPAEFFTHVCIFYNRADIDADEIDALIPPLPKLLQRVNFDPSNLETSPEYRYQQELAKILVREIRAAIARDDIPDAWFIEAIISDAQLQAEEARNRVPTQDFRYLRLYPGTMTTDLKAIETDTRFFANEAVAQRELEEVVAHLLELEISSTRMARYLPYSRPHLTKIAKQVSRKTRPPSSDRGAKIR